MLDKDRSSHSPSHEFFMTQALELAKQGRFTCDPNPMVGAIIVLNNHVIGRGFHQKSGEPHAEVLAIQDALTRVDNLAGTDLYVTLEPCSHFGRTPPCCAAIEQHDFKHILIGCQDPNPLVSGQGIDRLKQRYNLVVDVLQHEALALNKAFFHRMQTGKPYVQLKAGASLDGAIALSNGVSQWITGTAARQDVHHLRLAASAILTGTGTFLRDNPRLDARKDMLGFDPQRQPLRIIIDRDGQTLDTLSSQQPFQATLLITSTSVASVPALDNLEHLKFPTQNNRFDIGQLLTALGKKSINSLVIEAGPRLTSAFLMADQVDEIIIYLAPLFLGANAKRIFELPELSQLPDRTWSFQNVEMIGAQDKDLKITLRQITRE